MMWSLMSGKIRRNCSFLERFDFGEPARNSWENPTESHYGNITECRPILVNKYCTNYHVYNGIFMHGLSIRNIIKHYLQHVKRNSGLLFASCKLNQFHYIMTSEEYIASDYFLRSKSKRHIATKASTVNESALSEEADLKIGYWIWKMCNMKLDLFRLRWRQLHVRPDE